MPVSLTELAITLTLLLSWLGGQRAGRSQSGSGMPLSVPDGVTDIDDFSS